MISLPLIASRNETLMEDTIVQGLVLIKKIMELMLIDKILWKINSCPPNLFSLPFIQL